jgi:hypothetical protein
MFDAMAFFEALSIDREIAIDLLRKGRCLLKECCHHKH